MRKSDLWTGVVFVAAAVLCLLTVWFFETPLNSMFCGFTGAFGVPGVVLIYKYFKWSSPKTSEVYRERLEQEQIDLKDERKEMLRNKSGRYAYIFNLALHCAVMFLLALLDTLGLMEGSRWLILSMAVWLLVQYFAGIVFYWLLNRKY